MVACRGHIKDTHVSLVQSRPYESIGSGSPAWMGGKSDQRNGEFFAFVAKEGPGKESIRQLPGDTPVSKTWKFIARDMLQASPAAEGGMVYVAGDTRWKVIVGEKEWPQCERIGPLEGSPSGQTWACTAQMDGKLVMLVNGVPGKAYTQI